MDLTIDQAILRDYEAASSREWLVTNGIGGYASASLSGANTRRYHGLLVAALTPPTGRMTLLSKLEETLSIGGRDYLLSANQYPGAIYPEGYQFLESFTPVPAPTFLFRPRADTLLEKRIWMATGRNTTYVQYRLAEATAPVELRLDALVCWKDFHSEMHPWPGFPVSVESTAGRARIRFTPDSAVLAISALGMEWRPATFWHENIEHQRELERGLEFREDLYCPGQLAGTLNPGDTVTVTITAEDHEDPPEKAWSAYMERQESLLLASGATDDFGRTLVLAADDFVIDGAEAAAPQLSKVRGTVIAGYHWFADWGRDTMISLPGLCLATGRHSVAAEILRSFSRYVSEGMLPNRFPDRGETPEYNTVDATLWYFQSIRAYVEAAGDEGLELARELWPVLADIVQWHVRGTRYGIQVDPADGLLRAGVQGVQLTWMDAKVGDWVVTPRIGKPVEINALWYNALKFMEELAKKTSADPKPYATLAAAARKGFRRTFIRADQQGLYDVVGDAGPDPAIRPNQIFAVSLPHSPLGPPEMKRVLSVVEQSLLTPYGLRTLAPNDSAYIGHYGGSPVQRDSAYHQGTVWPWLLGPFVEAHLRVYQDHERARSLLEPIQAHLRDACIGSISEILDGDPPQAPNGCIAQAWSVAEILRVWRLVEPRGS